MRIFLSIIVTVFFCFPALGQGYKAEDLAGRTWHCYTTSDPAEPPWNGRKTYTLEFKANHTFIKKYDESVTAFSGHWDMSFSGTLLQLRGTVNEDYTIQLCTADFLKMRNTTGAIYFFILQQKLPPKD